VGDAMRNTRYQVPNIKWVIVIVALAAIVSADVLTAPGPRLIQDKTWPEVQKNGGVRFGTDAGFLPFAGIDAFGDFTGIDVELARELAQRMGLRAEFVQVGADRFYDTLQAKQCDAVIGALTPDAIRLRDFAYTNAYFDAGLVLVVPGASASKLDGLKGRTLAVEVGSEGDVRARWLARRTAGLRVLERDTPDEAMQAVEASLADAALTDTATARHSVVTHPTLRLGTRQTSSPYVIAVRADSPDLLHALDRVLAQVKADGTLDRIVSRWLDQ
jgi:ABC-type amino acid transport substrate-binding protein